MNLPYTIPTLIISYYPVIGGTSPSRNWLDRIVESILGREAAGNTVRLGGRERLDVRITGDVDASLETIRRHVRTTTSQVIKALETGGTYHGYTDPAARPSLRYEIVDEIEFLEPLPTRRAPGHKVPMTDYNAIMKRVDIRTWVEERGIREVWLWGYHGNKVGLWESNMAGPYGDISNSNRDPYDLPVLGKTYTVYHYNYQRGPSEAVEDHMHQIEALLNHVDGRDATPREEWHKLLFWGLFVGSDHTGKIVTPRCGWSHYPPNAERDYDWANRRYVWSDIEDWRPDGSGEKKRLNCQRWNCDSLTWFVYWMQNLPGAGNKLIHRGRSLSNWWSFVGDFDQAMEQGLGLLR